MRARLVSIALALLTVQLLAFVAGRLFSTRLTRGDEESDDFQVAAVFGGREFHSRARALQAGSAIATMGGIDLDLRDATLDPDGATLDLTATMGGIQVTVPDGWAIEVDTENVAGGFDSKITDPSELPADAPRLHIHAVTRMGGGVVKTAQPSSS